MINGFYARDLDADDNAFLEQVRVKGIANGSLANNHTVLSEEIEFWNLPYTVAPDVVRRAGPLPRPVATAEQRAMRQARAGIWHAKRVIRENEAAISAAEIEREQREWQEAQQKRKLYDLMSDAEWEKAAHKAKFGKTEQRHHVPQWKLDAAKAAKRAAEILLELKAKEAKAAKRAAEMLKAEQEQERERREKIIAEARATVELVRREQLKWEEEAAQARIAESMKSEILTLMFKPAIRGHVWTPDAMARVLGCNDVQFVDRCLNELVKAGRLQKV
ncbi:MAG TPA: hypothetical protein VGH06_02290 [Candidatus Udaeobacter sp.]